MIGNEAIDTFKRRFPKLVVTRCVDYNERYFVIEAVENPNVPNYNSPYYGIDKISGKITSFIPTLDLDAFFEAVENRTIFSSNE